MQPDKVVESPNYSEEELKRRTEVFIAADGPWARLTEVHYEVYNQLDSHVGRFGLGYRSDLTGQRTREVLIGSLGLKGAFNMLDKPVFDHLIYPVDGEAAADAVKHVIEKFNGNGPLCGTSEAEILGYPSETVRQALFRSADEIEKLASVNTNVADLDQQQLAGTLYRYRKALTEVCNYVDYAEGYLAHHKGEAKIHTPPENALQ